MNVPRSEFLRRYDPDGHIELDALRLEVERLRDLVEARAQGLERLMGEKFAQTEARVAEALEPRIEFAAREAVAYAESRIEGHEAALRALARRFAEFSRDPAPEGPPERPALAARAYALGPAGADGEGALALALSEETDEAFLRDAASLPIPPGGASRLVAARVIEHIAPVPLAARVLPHWRSRMAAGGELVVTTLDGPHFLADLAAEGDFAALRERLFGPGARALRNLLDAPALVALLSEAGFAPETPTRAEGMLRVCARA